MKTGKRFLIDSITMLALIAIMVYAITRSLLSLYAGYDGLDKMFSLLLIAGEFFILLHGVGYTVNVIRAYHAKEEKDFPGEKEGSVLPEKSVAILVAARHEPKKILEETFRSLKNINYKNKDVYFLDDSSDEKYKKEAEDLSEELGLILFRREERHGAKAGIVNDCLKTLDHKYVAIFDADQNPLSAFLKKIIPIMESDEQLAFVQTPQFYTNINESRVARGAAFQQAVFYEYICEGKNSNNAMFCCGTNIVFQRQALVGVGGLDESTVTEDFATSIKLHAAGWKSLYYPHVSAFGMGPESLTGYFQQQFRWANGTISVFKKILWLFLTKPFSLKAGQWWEYFLSGSYYLVGLAFFILMIFPINYLLFGIPSFFARPEVYFLAFLPYITLSMSVFYVILKGRNYTVKDLFVGQLLGGTTFSVYIRAALSAILGTKITFGITEKTKGTSIPYIRLWPQLSFIFIGFVSVVWGANRFVYEREPAIIINGFWALYHCAILSSIFYFNEENIVKLGCKRLIKGVSFEYKIVEMNHAAGKLSKDTWRDSFSIFLPERLESGTLVMCKVTPPGEGAIIFDGVIAWSSEKKKRRGFEANIGVVPSSSESQEKLRKVIKK